jgi:hypothetical protein
MAKKFTILFVYGTLRFPKYQKEAFGRVIQGSPIVLKGFKKSRVSVGGRRYWIISRLMRSSVRGLKLKINLKELKLADEYEHPIYRRFLVTLADDSKAWAYIKHSNNN